MTVLATTGKVVVKIYFHPLIVPAGHEFFWVVGGHVEEDIVRNAGVGYHYIDGPASSIKIVDNAGNKLDLPKGGIMPHYIRGDSDVCTEIVSEDSFRGAIFPEIGVYKIGFCGGYLTEEGRFYITDEKLWECRCVPPGKVVIEEAYHPTSVTVDEMFFWYIVAHVEETAPLPGAAYIYKDGPADKITIVHVWGEVKVPRGGRVTIHSIKEEPPCYRVDSRVAYLGAKFPVPGRYTIWLVSGDMVYPPMIHDKREYIVEAREAIPTWPAIPLTLALTPAITVGAVIGYNEYVKKK